MSALNIRDDLDKVLIGIAMLQKIDIEILTLVLEKLAETVIFIFINRTFNDYSLDNEKNDERRSTSGKRCLTLMVKIVKDSFVIPFVEEISAGRFPRVPSPSLPFLLHQLFLEFQTRRPVVVDQSHCLTTLGACSPSEWFTFCLRVTGQKKTGPGWWRRRRRHWLCRKRAP